MEQFADDLAELLDELGVDQPVAFCGLSMGGYIAWQFWRRHPQRLSHLILCDTRSAPDSPEAAQARYQTAERVLAEGTVGADRHDDPQAVLGSHTAAEPGRRWRPREQVMRAARPAGVAAALRGMAQRVDATPWLSEIRVPTLVVCGQEDAIAPVAEMERIARAIPQAEFVVIPASGHMAPLEDPLHVNKAIRGFSARPQRGNSNSDWLLTMA